MSYTRVDPRVKKLALSLSFLSINYELFEYRKTMVSGVLFKTLLSLLRILKLCYLFKILIYNIEIEPIGFVICMYIINMRGKCAEYFT